MTKDEITLVLLQFAKDVNQVNGGVLQKALNSPFVQRLIEAQVQAYEELGRKMSDPDRAVIGVSLLLGIGSVEVLKNKYQESAYNTMTPDEIRHTVVESAQKSSLLDNKAKAIVERVMTVDPKKRVLN